MTTTSLIIPLHNQLALTRQLLDVVLEFTPPTELILVDNGSTDGTGDYIGSLLATASVKVQGLWYEENRGFGAAMNAGIGLSSGEVIVCLNNDVRVISIDWLDQLTRALAEQPRALVAAELITYNHLTELASGEIIPYLAGWCYAFNRQFIRDVGVYDERFFAYYEDVDLCYRAMQAGYALTELRDLGLYHLGGATGRTIPGIHAVGMDSRVKFAAKWGITWQPQPGFDYPDPKARPVPTNEQWLAVPLTN